MGCKKDLEQLIRKLRKAGWDCQITRNRHWRVYPPDGGAPVFNGGTPSDYRSIRNFRAALKRAGFEDK